MHFQTNVSWGIFNNPDLFLSTGHPLGVTEVTWQ